MQGFHPMVCGLPSAREWARPKARPETRAANLRYGTLGQPEDVIEAALTADGGADPRCLRPRSLTIPCTYLYQGDAEAAFASRRWRQ
jgi:hypothetical protein